MYTLKLILYRLFGVISKGFTPPKDELRYPSLLSFSINKTSER